MTETAAKRPEQIALRICRATTEHLRQVVDLDARTTGQPKPEYWADIFERYGSRRVDQRFFLVAERADDHAIVGMFVGEVRGWEFGSEPCGWIFAVSVDPEQRQMRIGEGLFRAMCEEFRNAGITTIRTMVRRENQLHMSFFRGEGMKAGPYIQLELTLDET
jgi:ribosomal protein S18 acetylase RimI-like enzyme